MFLKEQSLTFPNTQRASLDNPRTLKQLTSFDHTEWEDLLQQNPFADSERKPVINTLQEEGSEQEMKQPLINEHQHTSDVQDEGEDSENENHSCEDEELVIGETASKLYRTEPSSNQIKPKIEDSDSFEVESEERN